MRGSPLLPIAAAALQDPGTEPGDQPGLFGDADRGEGRYDALVGVAPTQQRLDAR